MVVFCVPVGAEPDSVKLGKLRVVARVQPPLKALPYDLSSRYSPFEGFASVANVFVVLAYKYCRSGFYFIHDSPTIDVYNNPP